LAAREEILFPTRPELLTFRTGIFRTFAICRKIPRQMAVVTPGFKPGARES
jgi:hypothetical protein